MLKGFHTWAGKQGEAAVGRNAKWLVALKANADEA